MEFLYIRVSSFIRVWQIVFVLLCHVSSEDTISPFKSKTTLVKRKDVTLRKLKYLFNEKEER